LEALLPGEPIFINDVALDPQGNAYVTNSFSPVIYKVDPKGKATVFFQDTAFALPAGEFGFNGVQYDERGFLLVAFANQLVKIPVNNTTNYSTVRLNAPISPDGLLLSKDGKQLVVVSNTGGTPEDKVLSFISNNQWQSGSLSTSYSTGAVFPTTATSDGKRVYVLYSYLNRLLENKEQNTFTIQEVRLNKKSQF
jgi:sugar lactone lactonase YvrE